jgi:hypothetical protein
LRFGDAMRNMCRLVEPFVGDVKRAQDIFGYPAAFGLPRIALSE